MVRRLITLTLVLIAVKAIGFATESWQSWRLDAKSAQQWQAMPTWLGNPSPNAKVEATNEGLKFSIPEASKGMKWLTNARWVNTKFRYLFVRYKARGLNTQLSDYFIWVNDTSR